MEKLKQGDYVRNLTKEQFEELMKYQFEEFMKYQPKKYCPYFFCKSTNEIVFEGKFMSPFLHSYDCETELTFEEFKQRAINTFQNAN